MISIIIVNEIISIISSLGDNLHFESPGILTNFRIVLDIKYQMKTHKS